MIDLFHYNLANPYQLPSATYQLLGCELPPLNIFFPLVFTAIGSLQAYLFNLGILRSGRKQGRRKFAQKIKPGVQYYWDAELKRWVPVSNNPVSPIHELPASQPSDESPPPVSDPPSPILLKWPLAKGFVITQTFQEHLETKKEKGYKYYNGGLDLAYPDIKEGAPVYAAAPGIVKYARWNATGYGNYVVIDHFDPQSSASESSVLFPPSTPTSDPGPSPKDPP